MNPLFSIILPTYNRSHLLRRAICSVLQQTFRNFELIIVDDHSIDDTKQVVSEFSDKRILYIQQTENQGVSTARNTGIRHINGEFICFLDDDDEFLAEFLQEIHYFLKKNNEFLGLIWTGIAKVYASNNRYNGKEKIESELFTGDNAKFFLTRVLFSGITIHRLCFERVGVFNPEINRREDTDLVFRMLAAGLEYTLIPKILIKIHIHAYISLSRSISCTANLESTQRLLATHYKFLNEHLSLWLFFSTSLVGDYYRCGEKALARNLFQRILKKSWYYSRVWEVFLRFEFKLLKSYLLKLLNTCAIFFKKGKS